MCRWRESLNEDGQGWVGRVRRSRHPAKKATSISLKDNVDSPE